MVASGASLAELKLGSVFSIGYGRAFVEAKKDRKEDGIFIFTERDDTGQGDLAHAWRFENIVADGFVVVEPSTLQAFPFMQYEWDVLDVRRCSVLVVEG